MKQCSLRTMKEYLSDYTVIEIRSESKKGIKKIETTVRTLTEAEYIDPTLTPDLLKIKIDQFVPSGINKGSVNLITSFRACESAIQKAENLAKQFQSNKKTV